MEKHDYLQENEVYEREALKWDEYIYPANQLSYMSNWLAERLDFLDHFFTTDCLELGISNELSLTVSVSPNPVSTILNIQAETEDECYISSLSGVTVLRGKINSGNNPVDVSQLNAGVYLIKTLSGSCIKFVKE